MSTDVNIKPGEAQNVEWIDAQYPFDGEWMPDVDPALIGPRNFSKLINLRYNDKSIEGVNGYTVVNDTALDYTLIRDGFQLRSNKTQKSYILVSAANDSDPSRVHINVGDLGEESDFLTTENIDPTGKPSAKIAYITDSSADLVPRFSSAPQNSVMYCNGEDTKIFSGYEHRIATAFQCEDVDGTNIVDVTEDINNRLTTRSIKLGVSLIANGDMETDSDWSVIDGGSTTALVTSTTQAPHTGTKCRNMVCAATDDGIKTANFTTANSTTYRFTFHYYCEDEANIRFSFFDGNDGLINSDGQQTSTGGVAGKWNKVVYEVTTGAAEGGASARFQIEADEIEEETTYYIDDVTCMVEDYYPELHLLTTRPVQGFKFYVSETEGEYNTTASSLDVEYWDGSGFSDVTGDDDDTADGGATLATTGFYRFAHTGGNADGSASGGDSSTLSAYAEFRHFQELYLYCYRIRLTAGSSVIYHITCDCGFQNIQNVWDGVYRQPIQFQVWRNGTGAFNDYTLQVNQSSDLNFPVGGQLDALDVTDYITIMFEEQVAGMRFTMLGELINENNSVITMYYWNGAEWTELTEALHSFVDGTLDDSETKSFTRTGLIRWTPPTDEEPQTLFNSFGYAYKIVVSALLSGTHVDSGDTAEDIIIDFVVGVPALRNTAGRHEGKPFKFSTVFQNRLMLGGYTAGGEGNRMDYSVTNAPDVFNGYESSMDGRQSLYFGGVEELNCATQLYNRFGASVYSMLLVLKDTEVYLMVGHSPRDFIIYPVSQTVGCPFPHTLATAEIGLDIGQGMSRNAAFWVSHYGPIMFDGAVLQPLPGINNYFDPNEQEYISWEYMSKARGWIDQTYKEYNILIPSTEDQTTNNIWLVYDIIRKKWFRKDTATAYFPQCAWNVMDPDTGEQMIYGGVNTGTIIHMEKGTSWGATYADPTSGAGITQTVQVGDFFPSTNIWDETLIRKFKLICQKIPSSTTVNAQTLGINYYGDSNSSAANVSFQDSNPSSGIYVDFEDLDAEGDGEYETQWQSAVAGTLNLSLAVGLNRLIRLIADMNAKNWIHSFEFTVTTDNVDKGWQPIVWGIQYRVERKDNTATKLVT